MYTCILHVSELKPVVSPAPAGTTVLKAHDAGMPGMVGNAPQRLVAIEVLTARREPKFHRCEIAHDICQCKR